MSKLRVWINYQAAATLCRGMRGFANELEKLLDDAHRTDHDGEIPCRRSGDRRNGDKEKTNEENSISSNTRNSSSRV